jgi:hypothetical protein
MGYKTVPLQPHNLLRYVAYLSRRLSANSIPKYLNVVRLAHLEYGRDSPTANNWHLDSMIKGINRDRGTAIRQKLPITPEILLDIKRSIDLTAPYWITFWSACLVAFFGFLRKSNVFLDPSLPTTAQKHIRREDIIVGPDNVTFVRLHHSKTIQFRQRTLDLPLPFIPGHKLCPVTAILTMFNTSKNVNGNQPAFTYQTHSGPKSLSYYQFLKDLKRILAELGYNPKQFAGHSFRRGGATCAMQAGVPGEAIQLLGDWQSETYKRYIDMSFQDRLLYVQTITNILPS